MKEKRGGGVGQEDLVWFWNCQIAERTSYISRHGDTVEQGCVGKKEVQNIESLKMNRLPPFEQQSAHAADTIIDIKLGVPEPRTHAGLSHRIWHCSVKKYNPDRIAEAGNFVLPKSLAVRGSRTLS